MPFLAAIIASARLGYGPGVFACTLAFLVGPPFWAGRTGRGLEPARVLMAFVVSIVVSRMTTIAKRLGGALDELQHKTQDVSEAHAALEAVLNAATQTGIIGADPDGTVTFFNTGAQALLGYPANEVTGEMRLSSVLGTSMDELVLSLARKSYTEEDVVLRRRDGTTLTASVALTTQRGGGYVAVIRDITDLRRNQEAMVDAMRAAEAAARSRSEFLATVSHEIRTPLNGIIGMTGLLLDSPLRADQQEFVSTIRTSGEALLTIINDILDFSKIEAGKLDLERVKFDLYTAIEECAEIVSPSAHYKGLELVLPPRPSEAPLLEGDQGRIRQIVLNLLSNAIKFTASGEVVMTAALKPAGEAQVLAHITVADTGIGISPEAQTRLFQAFTQADASTTRRYGGTGLGLAISKRLVELMGGEIGLSSEPGRGATFWFTARFQVVAQSTASDPKLSGTRVLVVDDNATNRRVLQLQLERRGCKVQLASSAREALKILSEDGTYDALVTDQCMPEMDGLSLIRQIRSQLLLPNLPALLLASQAEDADAIREAGANKTLMKPVRESQLIRALRELCSGQPGSGEGLTAARTPATSGSGRILVVEDNVVNQRVAALMLRKLGYSPEVVANGAEALEALALSPYRAVLMDCQMPEMDGFEATREIRSRPWEPAKTPIIALTANAMEGEREKCLAAGMDDYLAKPLTLEALGEKLLRWSASA